MRAGRQVCLDVGQRMVSQVRKEKQNVGIYTE